MADQDPINAIIGAGIISSGMVTLETLQAAIEPGAQWHTLPAMVTLRKLTEAVRKTLYEPMPATDEDVEIARDIIRTQAHRSD